MIIVSNGCSDIPTLADAHDPSDVLDYTINYSVADWQASTEYFKGDVALPTTKQGIYLVATQPGVSGTAEVTWSTKNKQTNTDNTVIWRTINGGLALSAGETISSSEWKSDAPSFFTHGGKSGKLSIGDLVTGTTSGATGYIERDVSDTKIYIQNITGTFQSGEVVYEEAGVNFVTLSSAATDTITLSSSNTTIAATVWVGPVHKDVSKVVVTNTITTSGARTFERSFQLEIGNR